MASVGALTADLIARTKKFEEGMERGRKKVRSVGSEAKLARKDVQGLGAGFQGLARRAMALSGVLLSLAGVGGFGALSKSAIEFGSSQSDIAAQLKINTVAFQVYAGAIKDAGGDQEQMRKSILSQTQAIVQGSEGLTTFTRAFSRLGLQVNDLRDLAPETAFEKIAQAVATATDKQGALTAVSEIYGKRNAPELIEVMERLARDGFGKLSEEIERTYGIMDEETQKRLDAAADKIEQFKQRATIRVGELIAGEANFAAIKELGFRLLGVAGRFGGSIIDHLRAVGNVIQAGIGGSFDYVVDRFRRKLSEVNLDFAVNNPLVSPEEFKAMAEKHNDRFSEPAKKWEEFFEDRIQAESRLADEFGGYWNKKADEQRELIEAARRQAESEKKKFDTAVSTTAESAAAAGSTAVQASPVARRAKAISASPMGGFDVGSIEGRDMFDGAKRITSDMLRAGLDKLQAQAEKLRRVGDFAGADDLLDQRFGVRRQIAATRSQERIEGIVSGETSFNASSLNAAGPKNMEQNTQRIAELQAKNVELLEMIKNEFVG